MGLVLDKVIALVQPLRLTQAVSGPFWANDRVGVGRLSVRFA